MAEHFIGACVSRADPCTDDKAVRADPLNRKDDEAILAIERIFTVCFSLENVC